MTPVKENSIVTEKSPGSVHDGQWVSRGGNKKMDLPLKLKGFILYMPRRALGLVNMYDVNTVVRVAGAGALE